MVWRGYRVGENNISDRGDQKKHFISKSTLIYATLNCNIKFNNMNNVTIAILANTWYEFKSNIFQVFAQTVDTAGETDFIKIYVEGVMYDEARRPE